MNLPFTDIMYLLCTQYVDNTTYKVGIYDIALTTRCTPFLCYVRALFSAHNTKQTHAYMICACLLTVARSVVVSLTAWYNGIYFPIHVRL
jgi:hypothetical protein